MSISSVEWYVTNSFECTEFNQNNHCVEINILATDSETIEVVITDINGCETILEAKILVNDRETEIYIPNVFSPNDDGVNDDFRIESNDVDVVLKSMQIFNRWGNIVFRQNNTDLQDIVSWNGEVNGKKVTPNVFVYMIEVLDGKGQTQVFFGDVAVVY